MTHPIVRKTVHPQRFRSAHPVSVWLCVLLLWGADDLPPAPHVTLHIIIHHIDAGTGAARRDRPPTAHISESSGNTTDPSGDPPPPPPPAAGSSEKRVAAR